MRIKVKTEYEHLKGLRLIAIFGILAALIIVICTRFAGYHPASMSEFFHILISDLFFSKHSIRETQALAFIPVLFVFLFIKGTKWINKQPSLIKEFRFNEKGVLLILSKSKEFYLYDEIDSLNVSVKTGIGLKNTPEIKSIDLLFTFADGKSISTNLCGDIKNLGKILKYEKYFKKFYYEITGSAKEEFRNIEKCIYEKRVANIVMVIFAILLLALFSTILPMLSENMTDPVMWGLTAITLGPAILMLTGVIADEIDRLI
jgi:hypothetical protein